MSFYRMLFCILLLLVSVSTHAESYNNSSFERAKNLALSGDVQAQFELAQMYHKGFGTDVDLRLALLWYNKAADGGHVDATFELGRMYLEGPELPIDLEQAFTLLSKAQEQGHLEANNKLGFMYQHGLHVNVDIEKAQEYYEKAAQHGQVDAKYFLAILLLHGHRPIKQDQKRALKLLHEAAIDEQKEAQCLLGQLYYHGSAGLKQSYPKAAGWYANAALLGHPQCQYLFGMMYYKGEGVSKDDKKAYSLFERAAEAGFLEAKYMLGKMLLQSHHPNASRSTLLQACNAGHSYACKLIQDIDAAAKLQKAKIQAQPETKSKDQPTAWLNALSDATLHLRKLN